jgi:hypothetical protein
MIARPIRLSFTALLLSTSDAAFAHGGLSAIGAIVMILMYLGLLVSGLIALVGLILAHRSKRRAVENRTDMRKALALRCGLTVPFLALSGYWLSIAESSWMMLVIIVAFITCLVVVVTLLFEGTARKRVLTIAVLALAVTLLANERFVTFMRSALLFDT